MAKAKPISRKRKNEKPEPKKLVNINISFELPIDEGFYVDSEYIRTNWILDQEVNASDFSISIRTDERKNDDFYF